MQAGKIYNGAEFNQLARDNDLKLVKYFSSLDFDNFRGIDGYQYKIGLNIPAGKVNLDPKNPCSPGGIYFTNDKSFRWTQQYCLPVIVPNDAQVLIEPNEKYKADKIILSLSDDYKKYEIISKHIARIGYNNIISRLREGENFEVRVVGSYEELKILHMPEQIEDLRMIMVQWDGLLIQYIENPSKDVCLAAMRKNATAAQYISENIKMDIWSTHHHIGGGGLIKYINNPPKDIQEFAVKQCPNYIKYINDPSVELSILAVKRDGLVLKHIKNQNTEICLAAVKQNGNAIKYVKNKTEEIKNAAIKQNRNCIKHLK